MSHHISTRFVGAFAKIHITQGKYLCPKLQKCSRRKNIASAILPPGNSGKIIHSHIPGI